MITYKCNGGRLGENISFIYGILRFCKINNIPFDKIYINKRYKNVPLCKNEKPIYVFLENKEMFSNIWNIFKDYELDISNYKDFNLNCKSDLAQLYDFHKFYNIDNIIFSNWWSLNMYWVNKDLNFDFKLLNYICRPKKIVKRLFKKYKSILSNSIGIHIRRGDYLALSNKNILNHKILNKYNYYFDNSKQLYCIERIDRIIKDNLLTKNNILIFSDDIEWCEQNFGFYKNVYFIKNNKSYEDMILMSMCNDVIPNPGSFFSVIPKILCRYNHELI